MRITSLLNLLGGLLVSALAFGTEYYGRHQDGFGSYYCLCINHDGPLKLQVGSTNFRPRTGSFANITFTNRDAGRKPEKTARSPIKVLADDGAG
jgi:hypothetical protein